MKKSFGLSILRRVFALAFFFSIFQALGRQGLFAQTYVTNNGIIMERLPEEDIKEVERLNEEAEAEDAEQRRLAAERSREEELEEIEEGDDIDELFSEEGEGDTDVAVSTPTTEIVKVDDKDKPVEFSGNLSAELGGYTYFYPWEETKPLATFSNTLKFIGRPRTDFFVYGSFLTSFPKMDFGVYELYFDYTIFGYADISAGKRDISWSHSRILETNIVDYKCAIISSEAALNKEKRTTDDSKFTFSTVVPILSYGSFQFLAQYQSSSLETTMSDYVSLDAKLEGTVGKFSFAALVKRWATMDAQKFDPCFGLEAVSSILGNNSNIFIQGLAHVDIDDRELTRARLTTGIYKYFETPVRIGLSFEYQCIWGRESVSYNGTIGQYEGFQHLFGAELAWKHTIFGKTWTFGCKWFHDTKGVKNAGPYGTITPGVTISDVLPHLDFKTVAPIYYGSQEKYGLVFEIVLNLKY